MALRPKTEYNLKATKWYELDSSGNKSYKTGSSISASSAYSFSNFNGDNSGNQYLPTSYTVFGFDDSCFEESAYKETCRNVRDSTGNLVRVYLNSVTPSVPSVPPSTSFAYGCVTYGYTGNLPNFLRVNFNGYNTSSPGYYSTYMNNCFGAIIRSNAYGNYPLSFSGSAVATFSGTGTQNPPEMIGIWERCDPELLSVAPGNGSFVDDTHDLEMSLSWDLATSYSGIRYEPTVINFLWGISEASLTNTVSLLDSAVIPAGTFPKSTTIFWKIQWKSAAADETFETEVMRYSTTDTVPIVKAASPVNASIDGATDNVFTWQYVNDTGTPQAAFDLQISNDDGKTWTALFSHMASSKTQAIIPADSFLAGNGLWRVRGYNTDDVASEWSEAASVIVRAAPKPPVISGATRTPRITVSWQSSGQQAYRVTANGYDSGVVFGTGKAFVIPYYFAAGETVEVSVQIKNRYGQWSDKTTIVVQVSNVSPGTITMTASAEKAGIVLNWTAEGNFTKYYLLRDGEPIARTEETSYTDYFSAGESRYQIMGVDADGYYALSEEITLAPELENGVISGVEPVDWIPLAVKRGNQPEFVSNYTESITYQYYSGRMLPVPYSSRFREVTRTLDFTVKLPEYRRLKELVGEIVIYKDYTSEKIIGVLNDLQTSGRPDRPDISASITAVDYSEVISFD